MAEPITNVLGTVAIKHCGEYDATMHYEKLNVVTYNGSSYCAKDSTVGNLPTNTTYWDLMAEKGEKGDTGDDGYTPVKGTDYYTASDIAELENTLSIDVTDEVTEQIGDLVSATPLTASSTAGMTDTSRIYVNTTDGHWYWYNGNAWIDGGVYQGTSLSTEDEERFENMETEILIVEANFINDGYIKVNGNYQAQNGLKCTDYIELKNYNKIHLKVLDYSQGCAVAYYDSNKNFISEDSIVGTGSIYFDTITIPNGASFVRLSNYTVNNSTPFAFIYNDNSLIFNFDYMQNDLDVYDEIKAEVLTINANFMHNNEYIAGGGYVGTASNCKRTDYINVKGFEKISFKLSLAPTQRIVAFYDKNKKFLTNNSVSGTGAAKEDTINVPNDAYYVIFSNYYTNNANPYAKLYKENSLASKIKSGNSILTGKKIGFLGDSITNGYLATTPFRTIITNNTGSTQYNYGINSSTLSDYNGGSNPVVDRYSSMDDSLDYVCVLIGTNDTAPMGTEDSTDTETFYGALNTLIVGLINKYVGKKIMFMTLLPRKNNRLTEKCQAIKNRCEYYSIPCYDLHSNSNMDPNIDAINNSLFANADGLHPNDNGHQMLANKIQKALESI